MAKINPVFTDSMKIKLEKHDKTLFGNGEPGMDEQIRTQSSMMEKQVLDIAALKLSVDKLFEKVQPIIMFYKVGIWFAGLLGTSVFLLIWGIIIGKISLFYTP